MLGLARLKVPSVKRFYRATEELFPDVIDKVTVLEFTDAAIEGNLKNQIDLREPAMIALFGPRNLLNTAKSGKKTEFIPHPDDLTIIDRLNTALLPRLSSYNQPSPFSPPCGIMSLMLRPIPTPIQISQHRHQGSFYDCY
ncbi:hypothetical protein H2200_007635 [Cladophialophora chaetospira]|uniref:Uncharacterized protein n=1 Tax=Cladophialophora chaetospira TaxID=386627 RepID=A0AA39CGN2_9EURO|nr:hypothetical protein H2200_007635 [Cladophialophora chaetospira]